MDANKQLTLLSSSSERLLRLDPATLPVWGKMTAQHMVEHLSTAMDMSLKNTSYTPQWDEETILKNKAYVLSQGLKRGKILSDEELKELRNPDLPSAISEYSNRLNDFLYAIETAPLSTYHIYFGRLDNSEWLAFHYWHTLHHLSQFSLV